MNRPPGPRVTSSVLFVCMGNICRSPIAQAVFSQVVAEQGGSVLIEVDSAATTAAHVGQPPDPRACAEAQTHGLDISRQRARQVGVEDFERFEYILAMDRNNLSVLKDRCPPQWRDKLGLLLAYSTCSGVQEVADPYYGGVAGFTQVWTECQEAAQGLLDNIIATRT